MVLVLVRVVFTFGYIHIHSRINSIFLFCVFLSFFFRFAFTDFSLSAINSYLSLFWFCSFFFFFSSILYEHFFLRFLDLFSLNTDCFVISPLLLRLHEIEYMFLSLYFLLVRRVKLVHGQQKRSSCVFYLWPAIISFWANRNNEERERKRKIKDFFFSSILFFVYCSR